MGSMEKMTSLMRGCAKILFCAGFLLVYSEITAAPMTPPVYIEYLNEITVPFIKEIEREFNLSCIGDGGSMPYDVQEIEVMFVAYRRGTVEEARKINILATEKLLKRINDHKKLRPHLGEYPFPPERINISLSFCGNHGSQYTDGSVVHVFSAHGKLFYNAAENQTRMSITRLDGRTGEVLSPSMPETAERRVRLFEESYADAAKMVLGSGM